MARITATGERTLLTMEEVARARNKDVAEEERMEALMKAEKAKAPTKTRTDRAVNGRYY